jgi:hypothetical protein
MGIDQWREGAEVIRCPEGSMKETVQANPSRVAREIAEGLVDEFGIQGAYEYVNRRLDGEERSLLDWVFGEKGEKITFAEAKSVHRRLVQ